jgi:transcriptional regulator with XRE-family HTH domain
MGSRTSKSPSGRIAPLRKARGFTQDQLAGTLELSQHMVASQEVCRRRVTASRSSKLWKRLRLSITCSH